jgi:hypothetical protein
MKSKFYYYLAPLAVLLAAAGFAPGQSHVPGPDDYSAFSHFIAERNIFNPDRYPHEERDHHFSYHPPMGHSAPAFSFVGTMVYDKGMFAFFDGNNDEYRKSLQAFGTIAGYTVQEITLTNVILAQGSNTLSLAVGSMMQRSRDGTWVQSDHSEDFSTPTDNSGSSASSTDSGAVPAATESPAAPNGSSAQMSDTLKRLMMLRQQGN